MKIIYYTYLTSDDIGEAQAFFELDGHKLIYLSGWFMNDAQYRDEYMNHLFKKVGVQVKPLPSPYDKEALKLFSEAYGL